MTGPAGRLRRLRPQLLVAGGVAAVALALHLRDPHEQGSWGGCPWVALTGLYCPGCGVLRAVNDLTHGDVLGAAGSNLVFVLSLPVIALWWLRWTGRAWSGDQPAAGGAARAGLLGRHPVLLFAVAAVVTVAFTVVRNLPGSWLAP